MYYSKIIIKKIANIIIKKSINQIICIFNLFLIQKEKLKQIKSFYLASNFKK